MKKKVLTLACISLLFAFPFVSNAANYWLVLPNYYAGSLRSTDYTLRTGYTSNPYVAPNVTTISTIYNLTSTYQGTSSGTYQVVAAYRGTYPFTWRPGHGGYGQDYYLTANPDPNNVSWNSYTVSGSWGV